MIEVQSHILFIKQFAAVSTQLIFTPIVLYIRSSKQGDCQSSPQIFQINCSCYSDIFFCSFLDNSSLLSLNVGIGKGGRQSYVKIYYYSKIIILYWIMKLSADWLSLKSLRKYFPHYHHIYYQIRFECQVLQIHISKTFKICLIRHKTSKVHKTSS